jgi:hypothetical protein
VCCPPREINRKQIQEDAMFKKLVSTYLLMVMLAMGTGTVVRAAQAAPVSAAVVGESLPAAPVAVAQASAERVVLSAAQMGSDHGDGVWGWIKKIWKKYKKQIIKIIWQVIQEIVNTEINETTEAAEGVSGTVTETYEGTDVQETVYASQADYDVNNVQSQSYSDGGYSYAGGDYSAGHYEY